MYEEGKGSVCLEECGDGRNLKDTHACDDGNRVSKDGCSSLCEIEDGFTCPRTGACTEICGDPFGWKYFLPCDEVSPACINCVV